MAAPQPQPAVVDVTAVLQSAQQPDAATRKQAEDHLEAFQLQNYASFVVSLAAELANEQKPLESRRLASIVLKNALDARDSERQAKLHASYNGLGDAIAQHVKLQLLGSLGAQEHAAALGAAQVIGKIAAIEIPQRKWLDLVEHLLGNVTSTTTTAVHKRATLECLGFVCEELEPDHLGAEQVNKVLTAVVGGMAPSQPDMEVRIAASTALVHALQFASDNFEKENERDAIMQTLCQGCIANDARLRQTSLEALVDVCADYYHHLPKYIQEMFNITSKIIKGDAEEVALQAIEVWSTICDEEAAIQEEIDEAAEEGRPPSSVHHRFIQQALPVLLPLLLETMTRQDEDQIDDLDGAWNLASAAGMCLQLVACAAGDHIVDPVMEYVKMHITNQNWHFREAATFAFGSILEGPSPEKLRPLVRMGLEFLLTALKTDQNNHVKDTTAWTIGRICELLHGSNCADSMNDLGDDACSNPSGAAGSTSTTGAPGSGADAASSGGGIINAGNIDNMLSTLLLCIADRPHIAERVCCAIAHLASGFDEDADKPTGMLTPYVSNIIQALLNAGSRTDAGPVASKLRASAYEALNEVVRSSALDTISVVSQLIPVLLQKLNDVAQAQQAASSGAHIPLEPGVTPAHETQRRMELQGLLCGSLQTVMARLAENDEMVNYLRHSADHIMATFLQVFQLSAGAAAAAAQPAGAENGLAADGAKADGADAAAGLPTVHEECMLAVGTLATSVGASFEKYLPHLYPYIDLGLKNFREYTVCSVTVGVIGDICRAMEEKVLPWCDKIMLVLLQDLQSPELHRSVKPGMLSCFGEIALAVGGEFEKYLPYALPVLSSAAEMCASTENLAALAGIAGDDKEETVDYANALRVGVLEAYSGMMQGFKPKQEDAQRQSPLLQQPQYLNSFFKFCEMVSVDPDMSPEVMRLLAGALGDCADCLKPSIAEAFRRKPFWVQFFQKCEQGDDKRAASTARWARSLIEPMAAGGA